VGWPETLKVLQKQFEAHSARSRGLHHLMVEVPNDARGRLSEPDWFVREGKLGSRDAEEFLRAEPWYVVNGSSLPAVYPRWREVRSEESVDWVPTNLIHHAGKSREVARQARGWCARGRRRVRVAEEKTGTRGFGLVHADDAAAKDAGADLQAGSTRSGV
jgi:hypothetical protein